MKKIISALLIASVLLCSLLLAGCGEKTNMEKTLSAVAKEKIPLGSVQGIGDDLEHNDGVFHYWSGSFKDDYSSDFEELYSYFSHASKGDSLTIEAAKTKVTKHLSYTKCSLVIDWWAETNTIDVSVIYDAKIGYNFLDPKSRWVSSNSYRFELEDVDFNVWAEDITVSYDEIKDSVNTESGYEAPDEVLLTEVALALSDALTGLDSICDNFDQSMN